LLSRERPSLRAALEIGSALADILSISLEDGMVHGDIDPTFVKVDDRGAVHLEGFGTPRSTMAPEGTSDRPPVDMYGLGRVLHAMLTPGGLGRLPADPDGHDDHVVNRVLEMDFAQVKGKRWVDDVRRFLCTILAWRPEERPAPLDAANVLASVAGSCPGEGVEAWARRVHSLSQSRSVLPPTGLPEPEALGGPVQLGAPLRTGPVRKAPSSKGESTMAWSRDKIAAMLAEQDAEEELPPPRAAAPRASEPRRDPPPARPPEPYYSEPPRMEPARPEPARPPEVRPEPRRAEPEPRREPVRPVISQTDDDPFADPEPKGNGLKIGVVVAVIFFVLCGGFLALGGGWER
ncbi:MAG TPA: hypothetical protein PKY30_22010, partial [Myxococcota bacterium]|nr:hypothetical protein [Myxococcota bacterium]